MLVLLERGCCVRQGERCFVFARSTPDQDDLSLCFVRLWVEGRVNGSDYTDCVVIGARRKHAPLLLKPVTQGCCAVSVVRVVQSAHSL